MKSLIENIDGISISDLARHANVSRKAVYKVMEGLKALNLLIEERLQDRRGQPRLVRINTDHPYAKIIEELIRRAGAAKASNARVHSATVS